MGDGIQFYIGGFLVPDTLKESDLGAVLPLTKLGLLLGVPLTIAVRTALKTISVFQVRNEQGKIKAILRDLAGSTLGFSLLIGLVLWMRRESIESSMQIADPCIFFWVAAIALASCWEPVVMAANQGLKRFYHIIAARLAGPLARLVAVLVLLQKYQVSGYLASLFAMHAGTVAILVRGIRAYVAPSVRYESYRHEWPRMARYMLPIGFFTVVSTLQVTVEPWIIRSSLSTDVSAGYYVAFIFGNIPSYLGGAVLPFLFPLISERYERQEPTWPILLQAACVCALLGAGCVLGFYFGAGELLMLRPSWARYVEYAPYVWRIALFVGFGVLINVFVAHEHACRRFKYLGYYVPIVAAECLLLWILTRPGSGILQSVKALPGVSGPSELYPVVWCMVAVRVLVVTVMATHLAWRRLSTGRCDIGRADRAAVSREG
jgi:O-antigen/teichoic acid export membrane protein